MPHWGPKIYIQWYWMSTNMQNTKSNCLPSSAFYRLSVSQGNCIGWGKQEMCWASPVSISTMRYNNNIHFILWYNIKLFADKCSSQPETGPCKASIPQYFWNTTTRQCEKFIYGGCGGNLNRFPTAVSCRINCGMYVCQYGNQFNKFSIEYNT